MSVVISGVGIVSPLGIGASDFFAALSAGRTGIGELTAFDPGAGLPRCGAELRDLDARAYLPKALVRRMDRFSRSIGVACVLALRDAGLGSERGDEADDQAGVVVGSRFGNMSESAAFLEKVFLKGPALASPNLFPNLVLNAAASQVAIALGWRGPNLSVSDGELSGEAALEVALDLVRLGRARRVVVAAGEELAPVVFEVLRQHRALSPGRSEREWSSPFDRGANGSVMGEGAAALLIESLSDAEARGVVPVARVESIHRIAVETATPHAWARPVAKGVWPDSLAPDLLVSGADSTRERDHLELSLASALVETKCPLISIKGATGEFAASGLMAVATAALALREGCVPPLANLEDPVPDLGFELPRASQARSLRRAAVIGAARGGSAVAIELLR